VIIAGITGRLQADSPRHCERKRSNPEGQEESLDCFRLRSLSYGGQVVACAPRSDGGKQMLIK
jgi:hypothetical protein